MGGLFDIQPRKKTEFDNSDLTWASFGETSQCGVESDQLFRVRARKCRALIKRYVRSIASAFLRPPGPCVIYQYPSHDAGSGTVKVRPALPVGLLLVNQTEISFVHQSRGLQRMVGTLMGHEVRRQPPELIIDKRDNLNGRVAVACGHPAQQIRDFLHCSAQSSWVLRIIA